MKTAEIARVLLATPSLVAPRVLQEKLGQAGYSEAIRRRWINADPELGGALQVSPRADHREAMREAAKENAPAPVAAPAATGLPARTFFGEMGSIVNLDVKPPAPTPSASPASPAARPGAPGTPGADKGADVGDQVSVAEGGTTYTARVSAKNTDGTLKLSFAGQKPARDTYKSNEVRVTGTVPAVVK